MPFGKQGGQKKAARKKFALEARRQREVEMYAQGKPQEAIAEVVGVSQRMVSKDLNLMLDRANDRALEQAALIRNQEYDRLMDLIARAEAHLGDVEQEIAESKKPYREARRETVPGAAEPGKPAADKIVSTSTSTHERFADPRLLAERRKTREEIAKLSSNIQDLFGAKAPVKVSQTDPTGGRPMPRVGQVIFIGMKPPRGFNGEPE